jgi:hypothetical protein
MRKSFPAKILRYPSIGSARPPTSYQPSLKNSSASETRLKIISSEISEISLLTLKNNAQPSPIPETRSNFLVRALHPRKVAKECSCNIFKNPKVDLVQLPMAHRRTQDEKLSFIPRKLTIPNLKLQEAKKC